MQEGKEEIIQIHHQSIKNPDETIFCLQSKVPDGTYKERRDYLRNIIDGVWAKYPPPEGYQFMICNEKSPYFLLTKEDENAK